MLTARRWSHRVLHLGPLIALAAAPLLCALPAAAEPLALNGAEWAARFAAEVDHRIEVPATDYLRYAVLLDQALFDGQVGAPAQTVLLVDRNAEMQAAVATLSS